ncbi:MAG TPA: hypothetical protein P5026_07670 [Kiritimatiellia bacterium]|nr:hypothetical protein [Kiritimatiellia bacterium]HRU71030.1 hypothetical protein [Kiritimatiellia bacterium]
MESYGWKIKGAGFTAAALPLGMAVGAVNGGLLSDRLFKGKRSTVIAVSLVLCAGCMLVLPAIERIAGLVSGVTGEISYGSGFVIMAGCALCGSLLIKLTREPGCRDSR